MQQRTDRDALAASLIPTTAGPVVRLDQVADLRLTEGPSTIQREWSRRRITVQCNVRGRDVAGFVAEARDRIAGQVSLPDGYTVEWGGQFENMERANRRLMIIVPMALGLIFILLYLSLGSVRDVLVVATGIPLGAVGGIAALTLRGLPFTVSAAIGFIALERGRHAQRSGPGHLHQTATPQISVPLEHERYVRVAGFGSGLC